MDINALKESANRKSKEKWPGTVQEFMIKTLNELDFIEAEKYCDEQYPEDKRPVTYGNVDERKALKDIYCVFLAIVNAKGERIFNSFEEFCECVVPDTRTELIVMQDSWQESCSPNINKMSSTELNNLIDDIKKNVNIVETISSLSLLKNLITTMANRLKTLPMAN